MKSLKIKNAVKVAMTVLMVAFMVTLTSGCASVTKGTGRKLPITSEPAGLKVKAVNSSNGEVVATGVTPMMMRLSTRTHRNGVTVVVSDDCGWQSPPQIVSWGTTAWGGAAFYGGNTALVVTTGVIGAAGYAVDGVTGSYKDPKPDRLHFVRPPMAMAPPQAPTYTPAPAPVPAPTADQHVWKGRVIIRSLP